MMQAKTMMILILGPAHTCLVRARSLDRLDALLALCSPSRAVVQGVRADQPPYVIIPPASVYVLGEQLRRPHVAGIILITIGIACVLAGD